MRNKTQSKMENSSTSLVPKRELTKNLNPSASVAKTNKSKVKETYDYPSTRRK